MLGKIKYWDIWYDQKSLLLLALTLVMVLVIGGVSLYYAFNQPAPVIAPVPQPPQQPTPSLTPSPTPAPTPELPNISEQPPLEPTPRINATAESLAICNSELQAAQDAYDAGKAEVRSADDELDTAERDVLSAIQKLQREQDTLTAISIANASVSDRNRQKDRVQSAIDALERQNQDFTEAEQRSGDAQNAADEARRTLAGAADACRNLELYLTTGFRLSDLDSRDGDVKPVLSDCTLALSLAKDKTEQAKDARDEVQNDISDERRRLNTLENDLAQARDRLTAGQNSTEEIMGALQDLVESFDQRVKHKQDTLNDFGDDLDVASRDITEAQNLEQEVRDICKSQGFTATTFGDDANRVSQIAACSEAVPAAQELSQQADDAVNTVEDKRDRVQRDLDRKQAQLTRAEQSLTNLTNSNSSSTDINRAENYRDDLNDAVDQLEQDLKDAEDLIDEAKSNLGKAKLIEKRINERCGALG